MNSRPRRYAPPRPPTSGRPARRSGRAPRAVALSRRIFPRRLDRPAFQRRTGPTFNSFLGLGVTLGVVAILGVALLVFESVFANRVNPHVSVDGIALGGVSLSDAPAYLQRKEEERAHQPIILTVANTTYTVTASQFKARYAYATALQQAMADGHDSDIPTRIWHQLTAIVQGHNYLVQGTFSSQALKQYLHDLNRRITIPPLPAVVGLRGDTVAIVRDAKPGRRLDLPAATQQLSQLLQTHSDFAATLPVQVTGSPITRDVAQAAVDQAQALLSHPTYFSIGTKIKGYELTPQQLIRLLTFKTTYNQRAKTWLVAVGIDRYKLKKTMAPIAAQVDRPPTGAFFSVAQDPNGDYAVANDGVPGLSIDTDATAALILTQGPSHTITVPILHPMSPFTKDKALALHLDTEVAKVEVPWANASAAQATNIQAASDQLANILLDPGKTFDMTKVISPTVAQHGGYGPVFNTLGPTDITGAGGGVSTVASAIFQAAYQAGLPILHRTAAQFLSAQTGAIGYDALVEARPHGPTLALANDTKHALLMVVRSDPGTRTTSVYVFNNSAVGRKVQVNPPEITLNQDGSIDVTVSRQVSGDVPLNQDQISSHYQSLDPY